jgi:hypothetical protein
MRLVLAILLGGLGVAVLALPAAGFWSFGGGAGTGGARTGAPAPVVASPATADEPLFPTGAPLGDVSLTLANPNPFSVRVPRLALDSTRGTGGFEVDAAHAGCDLSSLSFATQTNGGAGWSLPASETIAVELDGALALAPTAADACQGATFTVHLVAP